MRLALVVAGVFLAMLSIPAYYSTPHFLSNAVQSFIGSTSGGNMNTSSMLRQMGYPPLHQVISIIQYSLVGLGVAGVGMAIFGLVAKKIPKSVPVKLVTDEPLEELRMVQPSRGSEAMKSSKSYVRDNKAMMDGGHDVLGTLETDLKEMKTGYENNKQKIESEKKKLEQREREQLAKIITYGEVLIKEITPDKFNERIKYYVGLKNEETGQPVDLSLLVQKFTKMNKVVDSTDKSNVVTTELENMKRYPDE